MNIRIGSAPDSWGVWFPDDPKQTPWQRFMDEVVEAGYNWIELGPYGYLPTNPTILQTELDKRNLKVSAGFVMDSLEDHSVWPEIEALLTGAGELLAELGAQYLVLIDGTTSMNTRDELPAVAVSEFRQVLKGREPGAGPPSHSASPGPWWCCSRGSGPSGWGLFWCYSPPSVGASAWSSSSP